MVQVEVTGGQPPHTVTVNPGNRYHTPTGSVKISDLSVGDHPLTLEVHDSSGKSYDETVTVHVSAAPPTPTATKAAGSAADRPQQPGDLPPLFEVPVPEGTTALAIVTTWAALSNQPQTFELRFTKSWPKIGDWPNVKAKYLADDPTLIDLRYPTSAATGQSETGTATLRAWLTALAADNGGAKPQVSIDASASWESENRQDKDQKLSERRRDIAVEAIGALGTISGETATGSTNAQSSQRSDDDTDRHAIITATVT